MRRISGQLPQMLTRMEKSALFDRVSRTGIGSDSQNLDAATSVSTRVSTPDGAVAGASSCTHISFADLCLTDALRPDHSFLERL